jgi:hypothetical protein
VFLTEPEKAEILRVWESKVGSVVWCSQHQTATVAAVAHAQCTVHIMLLVKLVAV